MIALILSACVLFLALAGTPLFAVILAAAMTGFYFAEIPLTVITVEVYRLVDTPLLLALPLFTFAGYILAESNLSTKLVRLTQTLLGWLPGGKKKRYEKIALRKKSVTKKKRYENI